DVLDSWELVFSLAGADLRRVPPSARLRPRPHSRTARTVRSDSQAAPGSLGHRRDCRFREVAGPPGGRGGGPRRRRAPRLLPVPRALLAGAPPVRTRTPAAHDVASAARPFPG